MQDYVGRCPQFSFPNFHPSANSPLSYNSYQPVRVKANTCFFWDTFWANQLLREAAEKQAPTRWEAQ